MKILLLADLTSSHTIKWANSLAEKGLDIYVYGFTNPNKDLYCEKIRIYTQPNNLSNITKLGNGNWVKLYYLTTFFRLRKLIKEIQPDIIHAHYVSSYGLLAALINFHPLVLSVWGSDVTQFAEKSRIHRELLKRILSKADKVTATSQFLSSETSKYSTKHINVIPFGIDINKFRNYPTQDNGSLRIGIFKSLEKHYGHDLLFHAFKMIITNLKTPIKLLVVGGGSLESKFRKLASDLNIAEQIEFTGSISPTLMCSYHNMVDIAVYPSITESFGVSVLESSACEIPVVVSDCGGLPEVVLDRKTGIIIPSGDINALYKALIELIQNPSLRRNYGINGRKFVMNRYDWNINVEQMIETYKEILK